MSSLSKLLKEADVKQEVIQALLDEDIDASSFADLSDKDLDDISDATKVRFTVGMKQKLRKVQETLRGPKEATAAVLPSPLAAAATVPVSHTDTPLQTPERESLDSGYVVVESDGRSNSTPQTTAASPHNLVSEVAHQDQRREDPHRDEVETEYVEVNDDVHADIESRSSTVAHHHDDVDERRNPGDAVPLILPTKLTLPKTDPAYAYLHQTLIASGFVPADGHLPDTTTFTHSSHDSAKNGGLTGFVVTNPARELLKGLRDERVGVLAAVGPARKGKSTFLSQVLQQAGHANAQFRTSSSSDSCTMGIWAWPELLELRDASSRSSSKWLVLDVEGFFAVDPLNGRDSDPDYYARLFGIASLLASVVVYFDLIEHAVNAHHLDVFNKIAERMRAFRTASAHLQAVLMENKRPLAFVVRDWRARDKHRTRSEDWTTEADMLYWEALGSVDETNDAIAMFASDFQFFTLPNFSTLADPDDLGIAKSSDVYRAKFATLVEQLLTRERAATRFVLHGTVTGGGVKALQAQLDTLVEAFSSATVMSGQTVETHAAKVRVATLYDAKEQLMHDAYERALHAVGGRSVCVDAKHLAAELTAIINGTVFDAAELAAAQIMSNPRQGLLRMQRMMIDSIEQDIKREAEDRVNRMSFEGLANWENLSDFVERQVDACHDAVEAVRRKTREIALRRVVAEAKFMEEGLWATMEMNLNAQYEMFRTAYRDKGDPDCDEKAKRDLSARLEDGNDITNLIYQSKRWLRDGLEKRLDEYAQRHLFGGKHRHPRPTPGPTPAQSFKAISNSVASDDYPNVRGTAEDDMHRLADLARQQAGGDFTAIHVEELAEKLQRACKAELDQIGNARELDERQAYLDDIQETILSPIRKAVNERAYQLLKDPKVLQHTVRLNVPLPHQIDDVLDQLRLPISVRRKLEPLLFDKFDDHRCVAENHWQGVLLNLYDDAPPPIERQDEAVRALTESLITNPSTPFRLWYSREYSANPALKRTLDAELDRLVQQLKTAPHEL